MHNVLFPLTYLGLEPFMIVLARALQNHAGLMPTYLAVTPAEALFARNNLRGDCLVIELSEKVRKVDQDMLHDTPAESVYGFMKAKYGGSHDVWQRRVNTLFQIVESVILAREISAIVLWNGNDCLGKVCQILARQHDLKIVYLENGYFPNTLQIDPCGVNAESSLCNLSPDDWSPVEVFNPSVVHPGPIHPDPLVPLRFLQRLRLKGMSRLDRQYYDRYPELQDQRHGKSIKTALKLSSSGEVLARKKPFALIVLQVHDDTQILLNSRLFKHPKDFLLHCYENVRRVFGNNYDIVVKLHPADLNRICYADVASRLNGVSWIGAEPVLPLLQDCQFVMVINSSVGLQSIAMHKPTVVFGESFYSREEVCRVVRSLEKTCVVLDEIKRAVHPVNSAQVDEFVSHLNNHGFVSGSWNIKSDSDLAPIVNKIQSLLAEA